MEHISSAAGLGLGSFLFVPESVLPWLLMGLLFPQYKSSLTILTFCSTKWKRKQQQQQQQNIKSLQVSGFSRDFVILFYVHSTGDLLNAR